MRSYYLKNTKCMCVCENRKISVFHSWHFDTIYVKNCQWIQKYLCNLRGAAYTNSMIFPKPFTLSLSVSLTVCYYMIRNASKCKNQMWLGVYKKMFVFKRARMLLSKMNKFPRNLYTQHLRCVHEKYYSIKHIACDCKE